MAQFPVIGGGARITDSLLTSMLDNWVIKTAAATPRTTTTMVADPDLTFSVEANATYDVEFVVRWSGLLTAGLRTSWTVPTGTTGNRLVAGPGPSNAVQADANNTSMRWTIHGYATHATYGNPRDSASLQVWLWEKALVAVSSTAGSITFNWAQSVANATGSIVGSSSYARYRRIA